jgi:hypothetical protein
MESAFLTSAGASMLYAGGVAAIQKGFDQYGIVSVKDESDGG